MGHADRLPRAGADPLPPAPPLLTGARVVVTLARESDAMALLSFNRRNRDHLKPWSPPVSDAFFTMAYWTQWAAQARPPYEHEPAVRLVMLLNEDTDGRSARRRVGQECVR